MVYRDTCIFRQDVSQETFETIGDFKKTFERTFVGITLIEGGYKFQSSEVKIITDKIITVELVYSIGIVPTEIGMYYFFSMRKLKNPSKVLDELQKKFGINRMILQKILDDFGIPEKYLEMLKHIIKKKHDTFTR